MTEKHDRAMQEMLAAIKRGEAKRRATTVETALALVEETIDRQLGPYCRNRGTHEWTVELHALAAHRLAMMQQELGPDHPLTIEWADLLNIISN